MRTPPRAVLVLLLLIAGCSFDQTGLGASSVQDAPQGTTADAPAAGTPDAPKQSGPPDARAIDATPPMPPDASNSGVACGTQTCTNGQPCCQQNQIGGNPTYSCASQCPVGDGSFACDGPEDCSSSQVCCLSQRGSSCTDADSCGGFNGGSVACRSANDCPTQGDQCCPVQGTDVSLCQGFCF